MARPPDLAALPVGTRVQDPFMVLNVSNHESGESPFTILTVGNAASRLDSAPFWIEDQPQIAGITRGTVVQLIGEITEYRERRQLKVSSIRVLPREAVDWDTLVPGVGDPAPWWEAIDRWRGDVSSPRLRAVLALFYDDAGFRASFGTAPAALSGPHARRGGLLKLTAEVVAGARPLVRMAGGDVELAVAGALLHGIGSPLCYTDTWPFELTDRGALTTPAIAGAALLEARVREASPTPCDDRELLILQHLILAADESSPLRPMTVEAEALRLALGASRRIAQVAESVPRIVPPTTWGRGGK